ncbi:hypothetical protein [Leptospira bouyouniensis]|uniref:hypothetical protein n=1 Tax=Leptospira bouyouniensis TaxID=2484911 RepID=UPI001090ADC5|nr:hypothetical protein [Leptospira bouyouniensis]TGM88273.1 hypothetical protein EHQ99_00210 [Leptospira bouyouniensis]
MRFRVVAQAKMSVKEDVGIEPSKQFEINFQQAFYGEIVDIPEWDISEDNNQAGSQKAIDVEFYLLPEDVANNEEPQ